MAELAEEVVEARVGERRVARELLRDEEALRGRGRAAELLDHLGRPRGRELAGGGVGRGVVAATGVGVDRRERGRVRLEDLRDALGSVRLGDAGLDLRSATRRRRAWRARETHPVMRARSDRTAPSWHGPS